jgi:hypothetical protein
MGGGLEKEIAFPYRRKPEMTCSGGSQTVILRRVVRYFSQRRKFILQGGWTKDESKEHINFLELLAALKALQCFSAAVHDSPSN